MRSNSKKILIIDDNALEAKVYFNRFLVDGYRVETAEDGEKGIHLASQFKPDLVILDLVLPGLGGIEVIRRLRREEQTARLPIIVFSKSFLSNKIRDAWQAGATKCLSKVDCNPEQLLSIVNQTLGCSDATQQSLKPITHPDVSKGLGAFRGIPAAKTGKTARPTPKPFLGPQEKAFYFKTFDILDEFRKSWSQLTAGQDLPASPGKLSQLAKDLNDWTQSAKKAKSPLLSNIGGALTELLGEIGRNPNRMTTSTRLTTSQTLEFLPKLARRLREFPVDQVSANRILVVAGDIYSRRAASLALEELGLSVLNESDEHSALDRSRDTPLDLVIYDLKLPKMTGVQFSSKLHKQENHCATPVLFLSRPTEFERCLGVLQTEHQDVIVIPFQFAELSLKTLRLLYNTRHPWFPATGPADKQPGRGGSFDN